MDEEISVSGEHGAGGPLPTPGKLWHAERWLVVGEIGEHGDGSRDPVANRRPGVAHTHYWIVERRKKSQALEVINVQVGQ